MAFAAPSPLLACPSLRRRAIQHPPALPRRHPLAAATAAGPAIATVLTAAVTAVAVVVAAPVAALPSRRPSQSRAVSTIVPPRTILSRVAATLLSPRAALLRVLAVLLSPRAARSVAAALLGVATAVTAGWFHPRVAMAGPHGRAPPRGSPLRLGRRLASTAVTFAAGAAVGVTAVALPRATARYRDAADIPPAAFPAATAPFGRRAAAGGAVLSAFVTDVADGDTLRVRHTPLRLPGSDANDPATYFARRALPRSDPNALPRGAEETLPVRLAGVDCPEVEHFGKPGQPLGETAKRFVEDLLVTHGGGDPGPDGNSSSSSKKAKRKGPCRGAGAAVRLGLLSRDQYGRLVATMWVGPPWAPVNVSAALLTAGLAVIYRGAGAVDGGWGAEYERLEADAKARGVGVWGTAGGGESPSEYKARMRSGG
ncbi:hypothetical protein MMPV_004883 [Pyropia vietnamensis]